MEPWITVFLGLMALCSLIQVAFLCGLAVTALRTAKLAAELRERAAVELRQPLAHLSEAARNIRDISSIVREETQAIQGTARQAVEQVREAKEDVRRAVRSPWVEITAFAKGVSRAVSTFREAPSMPRASDAPESSEFTPPPAAALTGERPWPRA
jgi:hypothetical protein